MTAPAKLPSKFSIKFDGQVWEARTARLSVSDFVEHQQFNHPSLFMLLVKKGADPESYGASKGFRIGFQRDLLENANGDRSALGVLDTRRRWARCYGPRVELGFSMNKWDLRDRPFALDDEDRLKVEVGRRIARVISEHQLYQVNDCALQTVEALRLLGVSTTVEYCYEQGGADPISAVPGLGANKRALELPAGVEPTVQLWTDAPAGYDGFGTFTVEAGRLPGDDRNGRYVLAFQSAAEWQTRRYESGGHAVIPEHAFPRPAAAAA